METQPIEQQQPVESLAIDLARWNELQEVVERVVYDPNLYKHADMIKECYLEFQPQTQAELALAMFYLGRQTQSLKGTNSEHELVG